MINLTVPQQDEPHLKPHITVVGVGGAGGNAVNNMIADSLQGVDFVVANTDAQALSTARTDRRVQLGAATTQGLGAGARPEVGQAAAEEAGELIATEIQGSNMVFITAGMGGGTGTGAAPVIARVARELGILTVGVVTKPFQFEGANRMRLAERGIEDLAQYVDTLIIIPNQNLFRVANEKTTFADAFKMADDVLHQGVRSITDLMILPGLINLDFADVRTVMNDMGRAMMGTGEATGERRALDAAEAAIANPLLEDTCMKGARGVLINVTTGMDVTLFEVDEAANRIRDEVESDAHIIFGSCFDPAMEGAMRVSVVATGINSTAVRQPQEPSFQEVVSQPSSLAGIPSGRHTVTPVQAPPAFAASAPPPRQDSLGDIPRPHFVRDERRVLDPTSSYVVPAAEVSGVKDQAAASFSSFPQQAGDVFIPAPSAAGDVAARSDEACHVSRGAEVGSMQYTPQVQRPSDSFMTEGSAALSRSVDLRASEKSPASSAPLVGSLFTRLSRLAQRDGSATVSSSVEQESGPSKVTTQAGDSVKSEEDTLEIPAFLRRQAN